MNMPKVTETLQENGISHKQLPKHAIRIDWILDGASRPVIVFYAKENMVTKMPDFKRLDWKDRSMLLSVMANCKFRNIH